MPKIKKGPYTEEYDSDETFCSEAERILDERSMYNIHRIYFLTNLILT